MDYIVDVQGFRRPINDFVVKELAVVPLNLDESPTSFIFSPPCSWNALPPRYKSENCWLERVFHGLSWSSGEVPYADVKSTIEGALKNARSVYVKGIMKRDWLQDTLPTMNIIEMEDSLKCPAIQQLMKQYPTIKCDHHHTLRNHCAIQNVTRLKRWYHEEYKHTSSQQRSMQIYMLLGRLSAMETDEIAYLSKDFILAFASSDIEDAWEKLPETMKTDADIGECRKCSIHFETNADDVFDGPKPMIKNCKICKRYYGM